MGRILVADSDPHILLLCQDELQDEGYEVLVASNAQEALGLLDQTCPDLVVLEIMLPDMSGFDTVKIIKGTCRQTPVIFYSTYSLPQNVCVCEVDGVVLKTHNLDSLKKAVQRFLPCRRVAKESRGYKSIPAPKGASQGAANGLNGN